MDSDQYIEEIKNKLSSSNIFEALEILSESGFIKTEKDKASMIVLRENAGNIRRCKINKTLSYDKINEVKNELIERILHFANMLFNHQIGIESMRRCTSILLENKFKNKESHFYKRYIEDVYVEREEAQENFNSFIRQNHKKCFVVLGKAGKGKTTFFCNLANSLRLDTKDKLPLLFDSSILRLEASSIKEEIEKIFSGIPLQSVCSTLNDNQSKLIVFFDAINELEGDDAFEIFNKNINSILKKVNDRKYPILFCVSCRSDLWYCFEQAKWVQNEIFNPSSSIGIYSSYELGNFPEDKIEKIISKYLKWFGLSGSITGRARTECQDPLILRYLCEAYTNRRGNNKNRVSDDLEIVDIGNITQIQRKKVFDIFVENILKKMEAKIEKRLGIVSNNIGIYTTKYLLYIAKFMFDERKSSITVEEVKKVAQKLNHPDRHLKEHEFYTKEAIFHMFLDEGLILDKHKENSFDFVFESYFEYSLGRYIAYEEWGKFLDTKGYKLVIKCSLKKYLAIHSDIIKKFNFTNLLGALQYAILVVEDRSYHFKSRELFLELIEVMLTSSDSKFIHRQKAFSILRATALYNVIEKSILDNSTKYNANEELIKLSLKKLYEFIERVEDFVIGRDLEVTLVKLGEVHLRLVLSEMKKWILDSGDRILLKKFASQVIARFAKKKPHEIIDVIEGLFSRKDYEKSFWLGRTLLFAITEIVKDKDITLYDRDKRYLWTLLISLIKSKDTPIYTKDLAFSILPYIAKGNLEKMSYILDKIKNKSTSVWGKWNLVYGLRDWENIFPDTDSSWIGEVLESLKKEKNSHIDYIIEYTIKRLTKYRNSKRGQKLLKTVEYNKWTLDAIKESGMKPLSNEKINKTGIVYSPVYLEPSYDNHIECRQRLQAIISKLIDVGEEHYNWVLPTVALIPRLKAVHSNGNDRHRNGKEWPNYLSEVMQASKYFLEKRMVKRYYSGPVELRYESFLTAQVSAGGVISAVNYVMEYKNAGSAWSLGRPPGHLANNSICIFNNIAIGARYAQGKYGIKKILIIDCDAHHGKHTAWVFRKDPNVIYFSIHVEDSYSNEEGAVSEIGRNGLEEGEGYNFNITYPKFSGDNVYIYIISNLLEPVALEFKPELIMISAGFDGHFSDELNPEGNFTERAYIYLAERIKSIAERLKINVVGVFEGGYGLDATANSFVHMMNIIGNWEIEPTKIGFVDNTGHLGDDNEKLDKVKSIVKQRIELMKRVKQKNPKYKLYKNEEFWKKKIDF